VCPGDRDGLRFGQLVKGTPKSRASIRTVVLPELIVPELRRHLDSNTLTGEAGASLAELMNRMGHSSTRAARVYLHAREERDRQLAATLDKMARLAVRDPAKASAVFARLLKRKRGFSWETDGEQLLRQHKPSYFDGTLLPRTVSLSEPLSRALQHTH
jgi:hypothetical protein